MLTGYIYFNDWETLNLFIQKFNNYEVDTTCPYFFNLDIQVYDIYFENKEPYLHSNEIPISYFEKNSKNYETDLKVLTLCDSFPQIDIYPKSLIEAELDYLYNQIISARFGNHLQKSFTIFQIYIQFSLKKKKKEFVLIADYYLKENKSLILGNLEYSKEKNIMILKD